MKIRKINVTDKLKKILAISGVMLVLASTMTGCGSKKSKSAKPEFQETATSISEFTSPITDEDLESIPTGVQRLSFTKCHYITDLSIIPEQCPYIEELVLENCPNITDLSFIYEMKNLKKVSLNDIPGLTDEVVSYLNENNISYDIDTGDLEAAQKAQEIIDEIITEDMTEEEKLKAIVLYVSKNTSYHLFKVFESNEDPLQLTLNEGEGVCEGIAYTTNALLRMANIESYLVENKAHAWNLVKIDGEYYYIDVTNLGGGIILKRLAGFLIDKFDFGTGGYMVDPGTTALTAMSDFDSGKIVIPQELIDDIENNTSERNLFEKYGNTVPGRLIELVIIIVFMKKVKKIAEKVSENKSYKK